MKHTTRQLWYAAWSARRTLKSSGNKADFHAAFKARLCVSRMSRDISRPWIDLAYNTWRDRENKRVTRTLKERLTRRIRRRAIAEIERRGGETTITGRYDTEYLDIEDRQDGMTLMRCEGWREYSKSYGCRPASLAYLYGKDDNGEWAVRVPGSTLWVHEALAWLTPAAVRRAQEKGKRVRRQGDVYVIETSKPHDGTGDLPAGHRWNPRTRYLTHHPEDGRKHRPLKITWPCRFVQQRAYEMGRSGRMGGGD